MQKIQIIYVTCIFVMTYTLWHNIWSNLNSYTQIYYDSFIEYSQIL